MYYKNLLVYQICKANDIYKSANIFLLVQWALDIIKANYIQGRLH